MLGYNRVWSTPKQIILGFKSIFVKVFGHECTLCAVVLNTRVYFFNFESFLCVFLEGPWGACRPHVSFVIKIFKFKLDQNNTLYNLSDSGVCVRACAGQYNWSWSAIKSRRKANQNNHAQNWKNFKFGASDQMCCQKHFDRTAQTGPILRLRTRVNTNFPFQNDLALENVWNRRSLKKNQTNRQNDDDAHTHARPGVRRMTNCACLPSFKT